MAVVQIGCFTAATSTPKRAKLIQWEIERIDAHSLYAREAEQTKLMGDNQNDPQEKTEYIPDRRQSAHAELPEEHGRSAAPQDAERHSNQAQYNRGSRGKTPKTHKPNFIARTINGWFSRLVGAASDGSFAAQEERYEAHRTSRDYIWNTVGIGAWGMVFPVLTVVVTQLVGVEQAGMFSMAFVVGMLLMIVGNYGVRTYQVSDSEEAHGFSDYQINRFATCAVMILAGVLYCYARGYGEDMFLISMGVYFYKMIDGLADVYEGRLQQMDKLYLAGVSQAIRSVVVLVVFSLCLLVTRNLPVACIAMGVAALISFVLLTLPLALLETPKSRKISMASIIELFKQCFPLFLALFLYALIDNMPKFVMEGVLSYDNQLYFNALYFPAQGILLTIGLIYKPQLIRITSLWYDSENHRRFDLMVIAIIGVVIALTAAMILIMGWIGIPVMSFLYGLDFEQFRGLCFIMLVAGGVTAAIDFLYQVITVMRQQRAVLKLYLITFGFSLFIPVLLVNYTGLPGAIIGYLIVMSILLVLLVWEYLRIRLNFSRDYATQQEVEMERRRPSELRAERERLSQHRGAGVSKETGKHGLGKHGSDKDTR